MDVRMIQRGTRLSLTNIESPDLVVVAVANVHIAGGIYEYSVRSIQFAVGLSLIHI